MMLSHGELEAPPKQQVRGCVSMALGAGVVAAALLVIVGLIAGSGSPIRTGAWTFAGLLPILLVQDSLRYVFFRRGEPRRAAAVDLCWVAVQVTGFSWLITQQTGGMIASTAVWGLGALVGAVVAMRILRVTPSWRELRQFVVEHSWVSLRLTADSVLVAISTYVIPVIVAAVSGLAAAGALRAGQTLLGGIGILVLGMTPVITIEVMRALRAGRSEMGILLTWALSLGAVGAVYGTLVLLLPESIGRALVGDSWPGASAVLLPLVLQGLVRGPYTGGFIILKARLDLDGVLRLRLLSCIPSVALPTIGAVLDGSVGAAWGLFLAAIVIDVQCIRAVARSRRTTHQGPPHVDARLEGVAL